MAHTMVVDNTNTMVVLLSALGFKKDEYQIQGDKINLNVTTEYLIYAIVSSEQEVQYIYKDTKEWQELINFIYNE